MAVAWAGILASWPGGAVGLGNLVGLGSPAGFARPAAAQAQQTAETQPSGALRGTIFDSISSEPLADARVVLWNTQRRTTTDSAGTFRFPALPPGAYRVAFVHDLLLELGVSAPGAEAEVSAGATTEVALATPSPFTILSATCSLEGASDDSAVAVGFVGDDDSGVPLPGATVRLAWTAAPASASAPAQAQAQDPAPATTSEQRRTLEAVADSRGWYRFCRVPAGVSVGVTAQFLNRSAGRREVVLEPGERSWIAFRAAVLQPGSISGTLTDQDRGWAVEGAEVRLAGTSYGTVSGTGGSFRFPSVEAGEYTLRAIHVAYGERSEAVSVGSGTAVSVAMSMSMEPIALDPIQVSVQAIGDMDVVAGGGHVVSRRQIEQVRDRARDLADVLRLQHMTGVVVRRTAEGELCVGTTPGQARIMKSNCTNAVFFVDNARVSSPEAVMGMPPQAIDRIVVYRPLQAGNLFGAGSAHGVIMVFTKAGRRPGR